MRLRVREVGVFLRPVKTRITFRYGKAVVTAQPYAHLRVRFEPEATGVSAAALPPLWFDKRAGLTHEDTIRDLLRSIAIAGEVYRGASESTAHGLHSEGEPESRRRCVAEGMNDLTAGFGVALLDAAVIDAACRLSGLTFHQSLRRNLFGLPQGIVEKVPERPLPRMAVRHTVGLSDPIDATDGAAPVGDGLPETLEEVVRAYRARWFKIKVSGDADASLERLRRISALLDRDGGDYGVTLDGNEQFHAMEEVVEFVARLRRDSALANFWRRTAWIEQPMDRGLALSDDVAPALRGLDKPVIIDESDGTDDAVDRALALGYRGISAKNCKGVYRTLHSFVRAREAGAVLSSEDLMNIPVVPLHQDLCVAAALGIPHSERNGHHYIRAFEFFSPREREAALREFPSLYRERPGACPVVKIDNGEMDLREINSYGFGVRSEPDWSGLQAT